MAFRITPRFLKWVLDSTLLFKYNVFSKLKNYYFLTIESCFKLAANYSFPQLSP